MSRRHAEGMTTQVLRLRGTLVSDEAELLNKLQPSIFMEGEEFCPLKCNKRNYASEGSFELRSYNGSNENSFHL
ncbi:hypothetical protein J6590_058894 [Homalodisca vitripennis]|nr:hypothetical protein J6590_058894 [Homalodisca vitripennis]